MPWNKINKLKAYLSGWNKYYDPLIQDILWRNGMEAQVYTKGFFFMILYKRYKSIFPLDVTNERGELMPSTKQEFFAYITEKVQELKELDNER